MSAATGMLPAVIVLPAVDPGTAQWVVGGLALLLSAATQLLVALTAEARERRAQNALRQRYRHEHRLLPPSGLPPADAWPVGDDDDATDPRGGWRPPEPPQDGKP